MTRKDKITARTRWGGNIFVIPFSVLFSEVVSVLELMAPESVPPRANGSTKWVVRVCVGIA